MAHPLMAITLVLIPTMAGADDSFPQQVAPILQRRCLSCHNDADRKGDFSLEHGGPVRDSGYVEAGDAAASYLVELITPRDGRAAMPKTGLPLKDDEIRAIRRWIDNGALWPDGFHLSPNQVADLDWWSLRPLARPSLPRLSADQLAWVRTPVDMFIQSQLASRGLRPSPRADRRALIRRLYFDLLGLPPAPQAVEAFVQDIDPLAYDKLVDRLLASPGYGERWGRHWLDVVHYADTHGYDKDKLRENAWPYRDYVVRALNEDKPYARFVQEQIAGDALFPGQRDGIEATGFIAAGPWDLIGHAEVPETKIDGRIARHLDRDDMVTSTMNTFCSLTAQCARCHNHKFDPVTQEHYYSLQAVFAALDRTDRLYDADPAIAQRRIDLARRRDELAARRAELDRQMRAAAGEALAAVDAKIEQLERQQAARGDRQAAFGYHSQIESSPDVVKWVQVDLGQLTAIRHLVYVGCHDTFNNIGHGFGFPVRYKIELSDDPQFQRGVTRVVDYTKADVANPGTRPQSVRLDDVVARYVRVTATHLAPRQNDYIFALAELSVLTPDGVNAALGRPVTSLDSIEAPVRWTRNNLVDGYYFGVAAGPAALAAIADLNEQRQRILDASLDESLRDAIRSNAAELARIESDIKALPPQQKVYAGGIHSGGGAFRGTGSDGGRPRTIHVLYRGNILEPRQEVGPGTVPIVAGSDWRFDLPPDHTEADRRVALARWLVDRANPLVWRSIANRLWQYHFGRGIVDTPNDFGRMGGLPTHPELLDWLAVELRDGDGSLKRLHRFIVTSAVYQQSSAHEDANAAIDADNRFLWRMNRRRLEAEALRDAVLAVSGRLDNRMYGPGYRAFVLERPEHSPHYEYHKHDADDPATHRRSIYRFLVRSQPDPFMSTLDCADSSQSTPKRDETLTALQALSLLNNDFMLCMAEHFSQRLVRERSSLAAQVELAFALITGRAPSAEEQAEMEQFADQNGLVNLCRVLLNLSEFVFVD